jgi:predicted DsbA family dithiol-disulfide isomerase
MNYAVEAGADAEALTLCLEEGSSAARVRRQLATARGLGVAGTPTFLLGRIQDDGSIRVFDRIVGSQPIEAFRAAVERAEGAVVSSHVH